MIHSYLWSLRFRRALKSCCAWAMLVSYLIPCFVVAGPSFLMRQALRGGSVLTGKMWRSAAPVAMGVKQLPSLAHSSPPVRHMQQALPALYVRDAEDRGEYARATVDVGFKHLMKSDLFVLQAFLRTFVPTFKDSKHLDLEIEDPDAEPSETLALGGTAIPPLPREKKKSAFMDIHVRDNYFHRYIVEMQAERHRMFDERALYYKACAYTNHLLGRVTTGGWYTSLHPVIALQVLDYNSSNVCGFKDGPDSLKELTKDHPLVEKQYIRHYRFNSFLRQKGKQGGVKDHIRVVQIELPRARDILDLWPPRPNFTDEE